MYSKRVVSENIEKAAKVLGWMPTPSTIEEVDELKKYIESIVTIESNSRNSYVNLSGEITQVQADDIRRRIENEQIMCSMDSSYWESRVAFVKNENGEIVRFKNRKSQEIMDDILADFEEKQQAIELLILGSRQVGISTKIILKMVHRALFVPHTGVVLAAAQSSHSELLASVADTLYNCTPWWLVPHKMPKGKLSNGSSISIHSATRSSGIVQGFTPSCVYLTN